MITKDPLILTADATLDFTKEDIKTALEKLKMATSIDPNCFGAWLAKSEILYSIRDLEEALSAAEKAQGINPNDVHVHTTLSRIWIEKGDKKKAEKFSLRARMLGWKEQIKNNKKTCTVSD
jgi:Flp pilus assembly protein TadD